MTEKKLCVWDVTLDAAAVDQPTLMKCMSKFAKKWAFQKECGESGYVHWQIRWSLHNALREGTLITALRKYADWWDASKTGLSMKLSPTSNGATNNFDYVLKALTVVDGPWTDKDVVPERMPRQFEAMVNPYPWQVKAMESCTAWEPRAINVLVDETGCQGKSTLMGYLHCKKLAFKLPSCNNYKDMIRMVCDIQCSREMDDRWKGFLLDIPRGFRQQEMHGMFTAIETIKDGYAYDDRYRFKDVWFDSPCVWVFMNEKPQGIKMTSDRWKFWRLENLDLVPL